MKFRIWLCLLSALAAGGVAAPVHAQLTWQIEQIYSNLDGTIQFVVIHEYGNKDNQDGLKGSRFSSIHTDPGHTHDPGSQTDFVFPTNLPSTHTAGRRFLIATQGFANLGIITPDYIIDNDFVPSGRGSLSFYGSFTDIYDTISYTSIPSDGVNAAFRDPPYTRPNLATNFAGATASVGGTSTPPPPPATAQAVEYYYADWDYYFETAFTDEIALLDGGAFGGVWKRTGQVFNVWPQPTGTASPTCRFFSTSFAPKSSHFYTPFAAECDGLKQNPNWQYEAIAFYIQQADASGNCPTGTIPLYRLYNNGKGGAPNHRYTTDLAIFNLMIAQGWVFEGDAVTRVFACVPPA
ncbi:MAG TPA: hypothetical protein VMV45_10550 [Casimicrobiaceae bacterium]|nr:hypothetical protein [Casimicrobiaceae bacterium]